MNILITGATGFIGTLLAKELACRGESVRVLCRRTADTSRLTGTGIHIVWGDVLDAQSVQQAIRGCDRVFHLAAYARNWARDSRTFTEINVGGLRNVLDAAREVSVERIVFTSTGLTIGPSNGLPASESTPRTVGPFTDYERSKLVAEDEVQRYVRDGLDIVIVNPTRVFGPGLLNEGNSVTRMIQWYLDGTWRLILGDGSAVGNYAFVDDVVNGHLLALERGRRGERYILGGENASFNRFFELVTEISGTRHRLFRVPGPVALAFSQLEEKRARWSKHYPLITPGWVRTFLTDWACSTRKAEEELGYTVTPLKDALARTVEWLREQKSRLGEE